MRLHLRLLKRLLLLRHAKSSWADPGLADFERPLNERGRECASFMGLLIAQRGLAPELILSSPALRARETSELLKSASKNEARLVYDERIYEASPHSLRQVVAGVDDEFDNVMLVGHNPGFEGFVTLLTGDHESMPTATLAVIELDSSNWADIAPGSGKLAEIIRPKDVFPKV